jgi:PleD family two-component response regulator
VDWHGQPLAVTGSIGVASFAGGDESPEDLLARADAAMYRAKRTRNQVVVDGVGETGAEPS